MPLPTEQPTELYEELALRYARAEEEAGRARVRDLARAALLCLFWCAAGLFLLSWSVHTTSVTYGRVAFWAGLAIGNGGIVHALAGAYIRGEKRGDW